MRNVLLIARNFAPVSHVSAERATKLAKYLPRFGWRPTVLTGAHATAGLAEDPALLDQVSGVPLIRSRAPEFSLFYASRSRGKGTESSYRGAPKRGMLASQVLAGPRLAGPLVSVRRDRGAPRGARHPVGCHHRHLLPAHRSAGGAHRLGAARHSLHRRLPRRVDHALSGAAAARPDRRPRAPAGAADDPGRGGRRLGGRALRRARVRRHPAGGPPAAARDPERLRRGRLRGRRARRAAAVLHRPHRPAPPAAASRSGRRWGTRCATARSCGGRSTCGRSDSWSPAPSGC